MAERREAARGGVSSARSAVTAGVESAMELSSGESGEVAPRESAPCCEVPAGEGAQAPVFDFDILSPACPSRTVLRHVVDRWTPLVVTVLADTAVRAQDIDEASVRAAKEEAERILASKDPKMSLEQAQTQLAMSLAQLSALERLRKTLKH